MEAKGREDARLAAHCATEFIYPSNVAARRSLGPLARAFSGKYWRSLVEIRKTGKEAK